MEMLLATLAHLESEQRRLDAEWIAAGKEKQLAEAHAEACRDRSGAMDRLYESFKEYVESLQAERSAT